MIFPIVSIWAGPRPGFSAWPGSWDRKAGCAGPMRYRGQDLWTGREIPVVALEVKAYSFLPRVRAWLGTLPAEVAPYNCDLDIAAAYLYTHGYWPCVWYEVEVEDGRLLHLNPLEDAFTVEFRRTPGHPDAFPYPGPPHSSGGRQRLGGGL